MNRRGFLASVAALPGAVMFPEALAQSGQQITHVDTKTSGSSVQSSVVKADGSAGGRGARSKSLRSIQRPDGAARRACVRVRDLGVGSATPSTPSPSRGGDHDCG